MPITAFQSREFRTDFDLQPPILIERKSGAAYPLREFAERGRLLSRDQLLQLTVAREAELCDRSIDMLGAWRCRRRNHPSRALLRRAASG